MNQELERLIEIAAGSGAVTARQRQIIRDKAETLGEDPDEAELLLESHASSKTAPRATGSSLFTTPSVDIGQKNKTIAALLAFFLGGIGIHKFYLGDSGSGLMYLLFCWTFIPAILALIDGINYLTDTEERFQARIKQQ